MKLIMVSSNNRGMNIEEALAPVWPQIVEAENRLSAHRPHIGTSLQMDLEVAIKPLCPAGISYHFEFNMSGHTEHIFYKIANPQNQHRI